jgi:hypothetical protein
MRDDCSHLAFEPRYLVDEKLINWIKSIANNTPFMNLNVSIPSLSQYGSMVMNRSYNRPSEMLEVALNSRKEGDIILKIESASQLSPFLDDADTLTGVIMPQTNQEGQQLHSNPSVGLPSPVEDFELPVNEECQSSDLTDIKYESPLHGSTASGRTLGKELNTSSESSTAAVQCDFEGCGRVCKDSRSLRYVISLNLRVTTDHCNLDITDAIISSC